MGAVSYGDNAHALEFNELKIICRPNLKCQSECNAHFSIWSGCEAIAKANPETKMTFELVMQQVVIDFITRCANRRYLFRPFLMMQNPRLIRLGRALLAICGMKVCLM